MPADPHGAYYTPADIVRLIVENTIGKLCRKSTSVEMPSLTILDPACGDGAFLTGVYSYLSDLHAEAELRTPILNSIYGVDLDGVALREAQRSLAAVSGGETGTSANLRCGDSLVGPDLRGSSRERINWRRAFPEVMDRGGFDAVIGNPPWISLKGRFGVGAYSADEIGYLSKRFGGNSYLPNTFEYFISLGLELTRPGGYFSFIVPDRLGFNRHFEYLRRRLLSETELLLLVHGIPFPNVTADTMIFVCRKAVPGPDAVTESRGWQGISSTFAQSSLLYSTSCEFRRPEDPRITRIVEQMESLPGRVSLKDICAITSGFGGKSDLITKERISDAQIPILKGDGIERYAIRKSYWFDFRREHLTGRTHRTDRLGASPRILIRKTGSKLIAAYDDSRVFPEQSLYLLYDKRVEADWLFILGILNSTPMNLYYRTRCLTNPRTIAHAKRSDLGLLPLPTLDLSNPTDRRRHDKLMRLVEHAMHGDAGARGKIDRLVCELYGVDMQDLLAIIG